MFTRKDAVVALAACTLLASAGMAKAETTPALTLTPSVVHLDEAAPRGLLMSGADEIGVGKTLDQYGINIYGWVEAGYTANLRNNAAASSRPGPFTTERGNHFTFNQLDLRIERQVDLKKFDVGGMVEMVYGTDSNFIQSNGMQIQTNGAKGLDDADNPGETPILEFVQAYVDIAIPVGNGLKLRAGKFVTLLSYETIAPATNPFYSHSLLFNTVAATQTGVLGTYAFNDQWAVTAGATRGWDQSTEDNNDAIDFLGQVSWTPNKKLTALLNLSSGPQNSSVYFMTNNKVFADSVDNRLQSDNAHWRTTIDPVVTYQLTEKLKLGAEVLYIYDGGYNAMGGNGTPRSYGDVWGAALYAGYQINDMFTLNGRVEKLHDYRGGTTMNFYEATAGVTIVPMPKDKIGHNLMIRPELRYDTSEDKVYSAGNNSYRDNWTVGCDVIFTF
ncbi:MAG: outer membrane beta-barrel protein [Phycisphaerae bacterium]